MDDAIKALLNGNEEENKNDFQYNEFLLQHSHQLQKSELPEIFWKNLFMKLEQKCYDSGKHFQMLYDDRDLNKPWSIVVANKEGLSPIDPNCIFIIDHAWTYEVLDAKLSLEKCDGLLNRMCDLMNIYHNENSKRLDLTDKVLQEMWKFNGTYKIGGDSASSPVWYVMDEFGSRIQHDGDPNCRVFPFYYQPHGLCYSLLFPTKEIFHMEEITRNYVESPPVDDVTRDAQMLPWFPEDLTHIDIKQEEPSFQFFENYCVSDLIPDYDYVIPPLPKHRKLKVYTDYELIKEHLTDSRYEICVTENEADIIWIFSHFKDFRSLSERPGSRVNQFPGENVLTVKDLLAIVSRRMADNNNGHEPPWMIETFCLKRELAQFVSRFQRPPKQCLKNNIWIVKPWNLARGLDHTITSDLNHILRLPSTGPKIAQKYLHDPVLFHREDIRADVKFDLRFIVLLTSVKPLKVAVYRNFWIRFANKSFDLQDLQDTQKHFTVNNYNSAPFLQMFCEDFIEQFEDEYPLHSWIEIERKIYQMIIEVFQGAVKRQHPAGIANNPQSKSSYGFDVMIDWTKDTNGSRVMQPKLLEVNFNSDCKRACEYYPNFFNEIFNFMFLDEMSDSITLL